MTHDYGSGLLSVDTNFGTGAAGLRAFRDESSEISEATTDEHASRFRARTTAIHLGSVLLFDSHSTAMRMHRSLTHIARSEIHHLQLQLPIAGQIHTAQHSLEPGDLGIHDMTRASTHTIVPPPDSPLANHLMIMVPRSQLAPLLTSRPEAAHGLRLTGQNGYAQLIGSYVRSLQRHATEITEPERAAAVRALLLLIAAAVDESPRASAGDPTLHRRAKLALIKQALDDELPDEVTLGEVCRRFAVSRATLYRLFEEEGGVVSYLRERRLQRAARMLISPAQRHLRILDIAIEHQFGSDTAFIRAFKRQFGISPAALRDAAQRRASAGRLSAQRSAEQPRNPLQWMREL